MRGEASSHRHACPSRVGCISRLPTDELTKRPWRGNHSASMNGFKCTFSGAASCMFSRAQRSAPSTGRAAGLQQALGRW